VEVKVMRISIAVLCLLLASFANAAEKESDFWKRQGAEIKELQVPRATSPQSEAAPRERESSTSDRAEENLNQFLDQQIKRETLEQLRR
jgi:hypothetical protein